MDASVIKSKWEQRRNAVEAFKANDALDAPDAAVDARLTEEIRSLDEVIANGLAALDNEKRYTEQVEKLEIRSTPTPKDDAYEAALKFARGESRSLDLIPNMEARALSKGTASAGGVTVGISYYDEIVKSMRDLSTVMAAGAKVLTTERGDDLTVPVSNTWSAAAIVAEAGAIGVSEPAFGTNVVLRAYKYAFLAQASSELVQDSWFNPVQYLLDQAGEAMANGTGAHFVTGTGSGQPNGITNATVGKTTAAVAAVTADEIIDAYHSLLRPYRTNASWMFNDATIAAIRKLKDSTNQYLWQPGMTVGAPDLLLGKPVLTDPAMAIMATGAKFGVFGDLSKAYLVRLSGGFRVERSDDYAFNTDQATWRFILRADGNIVDAAAARVIRNA